MLAFASFTNFRLEKHVMSKNKTAPWQSLDLLPVVQEKILEFVEASELTLINLEAMKNRPDILSSKTCEQAAVTYEKQVSQLLLLREQCSQWHRNDYLSQTQKKSLIALDKDISRLEKLTQQILFIARHLAEPSIDSKLTGQTLTFSKELFKTEFTPATITLQHLEVMQAIHERVITLAAQDLEGIEIFEATLDYLPMVDDIVSHNNRSVVMDYADHYPGFREYIILLEELSEKMAGVQIKFPPDA